MRSLIHNHKYPKAVLAFLKKELKLGKRYVVLDIHTHDGGLSSLLVDEVHLVCSQTTDAAYQDTLTQVLEGYENYMGLVGTPDIVQIEEDSMDCIFIDDTLLKFDIKRVAKEFERVLRLNSYVLFFEHRLQKLPQTFTAAYARFLSQQNSKPIVLDDLVDNKVLTTFFNSGLYTKDFDGFQSYDWAALQAYTDSLLEGEDYNVAALQQLFEEYQKEGGVRLDFRLRLSYGLFNKYVPEISLRKSIFFNLLRPFAFVFYVLVKANIYFWRFIFKIKEKLFGK